MTFRMTPFTQSHHQMILIVPWSFKLLEDLDKMILPVMNLQVFGMLADNTSESIPLKDFSTLHFPPLIKQQSSVASMYRRRLRLLCKTLPSIRMILVS